MSAQYEQFRRPGYLLILMSIILMVGIVVAGYQYYRNYEKHYRTSIENELFAITQLKVDELVRWRKERLADANILFKNALLSSLVQRFFKNPEDAGAQLQLQEWMDKYHVHYDYEQVSLLDAQGVERMTVPDTPEPVTPHICPDAFAALRSGKVTFLDFHRGAPDRPIHLSLVVPLFDEQDGSQPLGAFVLRINPDHYLYPFIRRWPTPSETAETLLIRRDGNEALFLSELRFQKNTALNLRVPLDKIELPAVKAVLGQKGIVEGMDYRGVPVIACTLAIPDSPWFLVSRMDTSEVYGPVRERLWEVVVFIGIMLLSVFTTLGFFWRHQRARFYRELFEKEKQAEETVRSLNQQIEYILGATKTGLDIIDSDFNIRYIDSEWKKIYGDPTGRKCYEYFMERKGMCPGCGIPKALETKTSTITEEVLVKENNRPIQVTTIPFQNEKGEWLVAEVNVDITERKKIEEALKKSEVKYQSLIENANDAIISINREGMIIGFNKKAEEMFGYSREEIMGKPSYLLAPPQVRENQKKVLERWRETGCIDIDEKLIEGRGLKKDGKEFHAEFSCYILEHYGEVINTAMVRDISKRKRMEGILQESEEKYRSLVESSSDHVFIISLDGTYLTSNGRQNRLGLQEGEVIIGRHYREMYPPEVAESYQKYSDYVLSHKESVTFEHPLPLSDGTHYHLDTLYPLYREGKVWAVGGICRDITDLKQAEKSLIDSREQLRRLTSHLTKVEERERARLSRTLHDQVGQLVTVLGINLNAVRNQVKSTGADEAIDCLDEAILQVQQVAQQVRYVMSELRPAVLDEFGLIPALRWYSSRLPNQTALEITISGEEAETDLSKKVKIVLFRIAQEALVNVIKHAHSRKVAIAMENTAKGKRFTITDDGVGFITTSMEKNMHQEKWGLSIIRERATSIGAEASIISEPGRGTQVVVELRG